MCVTALANDSDSVRLNDNSGTPFVVPQFNDFHARDASACISPLGVFMTPVHLKAYTGDREAIFQNVEKLSRKRSE
jgi:hypothetical protein